MSDPAAAHRAAAATAPPAEAAAAARGGGGEPSSSGGPDVRVGEEGKDSCVPKFDALWFCYSPGYQLQQYYIHGRVDDCSSKWSALIDCLKKRTKFKDEVLAAEAAASKHPLWDIRTHAEAEEAWRNEFGHLRGEAPADAADGAHHSGKATLV